MSPREEQQNLLSFLDAIMACLENYPNLKIDVPFIDVNITINAMTLLMILLRKFCSEEDIIKWLAKFLVYTLPTLELALKGVILSNLKLEISCTTDPWIPSEWRQDLYTESSSDDNTNSESNIPISSIDYRSILQINPTTAYGSNFYFKSRVEYTHDTGDKKSRIVGEKYSTVYENVTSHINSMPSLLAQTQTMYDPSKIVSTGDIASVYQLARADDMNAFLWFVANHGFFYSVNRTDLSNPTIANNAVTASTKCTDFVDSWKIVDNNNYEVYYSGDIVSTKYGEQKSSNYLICYNGDQTINDKDTAISYYSHLIPCSNRLNSFNWYVDRNNYMTYNMGAFNDKKERDYTKEFPLFNVKCRHQSGNLPTNASLQVQALPKPFLHYIIPSTDLSISKIPYLIPFERILFDEDGNFSQKGHYTIKVAYDATKKIATSQIPLNPNTGCTYYRLVDNKDQETDYYLQCNKKLKQPKIVDNNNQEVITKDNKKFINTCLFQCYPGLTIYEFNFDYVMGMRLFEPKTVAYRIFNTLMEFRMNGPSLKPNETFETQTISKIIERLMFEDEEVKDCFFSFSNDKYAELLEESELKRSQQYPFASGAQSFEVDKQTLLDAFENFDASATLEEQVSVIEGLIDELKPSNETTASTTNNSGTVSYDISKDFIMESVKILGLALLETVISPKMLLLFAVNKGIMGRSNTEGYPDIQTLLTSLSTLVTAMIAEIMEVIIKELLGLVMKYVKPILAKYSTMVITEQLTFYRELIKKIIDACSFSFGSGNRLLDTSLDIVQYADITETERPQTDNC